MWQQIPDKVSEYPVGTVMLVSMDPDHYFALPTPGFWDGHRWVVSEETYSDHKRWYLPTHYQSPFPLPSIPTTDL